MKSKYQEKQKHKTWSEYFTGTWIKALWPPLVYFSHLLEMVQCPNINLILASPKSHWISDKQKDLNRGAWHEQTWMETLAATRGMNWTEEAGPARRLMQCPRERWEAWGRTGSFSVERSGMGDDSYFPRQNQQTWLLMSHRGWRRRGDEDGCWDLKRMVRLWPQGG